MSKTPALAWLLYTLMTAVLLSGCGTYVPEGATVVSVTNTKLEFERGELMPSHNELGQRSVIKMKWYDTNTFLTTATLSPGLYSFRARNFDGAGMQRNIRIEPGKDLYEIDMAADKPAEDTETAEGPAVAGKLQGYRSGRRAASVSVLFIGSNIVMRSANVEQDGTFTVNAPQTGPWKIEVHMLGPAPRSYVHPLVDIQDPVNLGSITLQ